MRLADRPTYPTGNVVPMATRVQSHYKKMPPHHQKAMKGHPHYMNTKPMSTSANRLTLKTVVHMGINRNKKLQQCCHASTLIGMDGTLLRWALNCDYEVEYDNDTPTAEYWHPAKFDWGPGQLSRHAGEVELDLTDGQTIQAVKMWKLVLYGGRYDGCVVIWDPGEPGWEEVTV